jgi:CBS domain containing-hemolysin-like protein
MLPLVLFLLFAVVISFICSLMEALLLSTPISFINLKDTEGDKAAGYFKKFKENIDKPLSAILTINTIANTVGAVGVGAQATALWGNLYFGFVSAGLTLIILFFSEIIPKTIGATYWRKMALNSVSMIRTMIVIAYPFVFLSEVFTRIIGKRNHEATISREEVSAMMDIAVEEGEFETKESKIIKNIMRLETVKVDDIMTPQIVVSAAPEEMTVAEFYKNKNFLHYARIPVFADDNEDNITGYVLRQAVLEQVANDSFHTRLADIRRNIVVAEEGQSITTLWETLLEQKEHIAIIVDQYGSFEGVVTLEDIIESIFGLEIVDETDNIVDMQQYARNKWKERREKYKHIISTEEAQSE